MDGSFGENRCQISSNYLTLNERRLKVGFQSPSNLSVGCRCRAGLILVKLMVKTTFRSFLFSSYGAGLRKGRFFALCQVARNMDTKSLMSLRKSALLAQV